MKKLFKKIDKEKMFTGLFGLVAIVAIIFEMAFANFDQGSIAGAIKDIAGTLLDAAMLFVALNVFLPKKKTNEGFEENFEEEMKKLFRNIAL